MIKHDPLNSVDGQNPAPPGMSSKPVTGERIEALNFWSPAAKSKAKSLHFPPSKSSWNLNQKHQTESWQARQMGAKWG